MFKILNFAKKTRTSKSLSDVPNQKKRRYDSEPKSLLNQQAAGDNVYFILTPLQLVKRNRTV